MRNYIYKCFILIALPGLLLVSGCKKKYFDINENPNSPEKVEAKDVLPSAEIAIAYVVGNDFQIYGSIWSQYWTQNPNSSQYKEVEQYNPSADDFDNAWRILYSDALQDLDFVVKYGQANQRPQYVAIAKILQAYTYQLLTDNFGDIPFSQALKAESGEFNPSYDSQQKVYEGIISLLNNGISLIDISDPYHPDKDDIYFNGDMEMWQKFANTLKLRVYMRLSEIDPGTAQMGIQSLAGLPLLGSGENALVNYTSTGGNTNPLYSTIVGLSLTQNLVGSATTVDNMVNLNDDRVTKFYNPLGNGSFAGLKQGFYDAGTPLTSISLPAAITGANATEEESATAPVKLMSDYESLFLQAEAAARGWLNAGEDEALYYEAITASFTAYGLNKREQELPDESIVEVTDDSLAIFYYTQDTIAYPTSGTLEEKLKAIAVQKWYAMTGNQGIEAFAEYRRTGYPDFFSPSVVSNIGSGRMPSRFFYPSSELTRNPNVPAQKRIFERVWWDVKDNIVQ